MVRRRQGRRRRRRLTSPSAMSSTAVAALAIYLMSLSSSAPGVATSAAVSATPRHPRHVDVDVDVGVGRPRRGGIGGRGQQGPTIDSSWVERSEEELVRVSKRKSSEQEGRDDAQQLRQSPSSSSGGGSTSCSGRSSSSSSTDGAKKDEKTCSVIKTIGGTVPDILEDSAWCVGEEDCVRPAAEGAGYDDKEQGVPEGPGVSSGSSTKTIGGTVPDVLEDSAWCVGEEDCVRPATEGADDDRTEVVAGGLDGSSGSSAAGVYGGEVSPGVVDGERSREAEAGSKLSAAAAVGKEPIPGEGDGEPDGEAHERPVIEAATGVSDRHSDRRTRRRTTTDAAATASSADTDPRLDEDGVHREAPAVYPYSRPASSKQQGAATTAISPPDVAAEPPSQQERRGPMVKGEGANTNTNADTRRRKLDAAGRRGASAAVAGDGGKPAKRDEGGAGGRGPERRGRGSAAGAGARKGGRSRGRDLSIETAEEGRGEGREKGEEEVLERVTAVDRGRSSWRTFVCALLVCAVVFGTYLRGTLLSWVPSPLFGRDRREGWAMDLDSAIASARSRASSFCSGRATVFSEDPVDDSDLPELISDHEGDGGGGDRGSNGDGEAPLMWDTRPKPDDYLVFHPVLGVVPAGAVRAWGGDGRGGWSGGETGRNEQAVPEARAAGAAPSGAVSGAPVNGGGHGAEGVTGGCSKEPCCSPRRDRAGGKISKAVGDGKRKRLPPVRNTDEWLEWVAAREATAAAAAAAAANVPNEATPEAIVPIEETGVVPTLMPPDGAGAAPPDEAGEAGAGVAAKEVVPAEVPGGGRAISGGGETERSGGGRARATATTEATVGAEKDPSSLSHTPAAFSLQFGVGNGTGNTCNGGGGGGGGGGGVESRGEGGSGRPGGAVDSGSGCDDSLSFGGGCSSDDGRDVRVDDFSARLSSEQPPAVTAAYHVS